MIHPRCLSIENTRPMTMVTKKSQLICPMILEDHRLGLLLERSRVPELFEIFAILTVNKNLLKLKNN
jgi:hypothetical protein